MAGSISAGVILVGIILVGRLGAVKGGGSLIGHWFQGIRLVRKLTFRACTRKDNSTANPPSFQSCTSKGKGRQGIGSVCKEFRCFDTMPCHLMPLPVHFYECMQPNLMIMLLYIYIERERYTHMYIHIYIYIYDLCRASIWTPPKDRGDRPAPPRPPHRGNYIILYYHIYIYI